MTESKLLKKVFMTCPICGKQHEVEERLRWEEMPIKGVMTRYQEIYYYCVNASDDECEFVPGGVMNKNLLNARDAYRKAAGLLTSSEIREIRESYGLSQQDFARLLGLGDVTITRYETKAIQDEVYDTLLRLVKDNPLQALELLNKNSSKFSRDKYQEIRNRILEKIDGRGKEYLSRQVVEAYYAVYDKSTELNGFTSLNFNKIEATISYMANKLKDLIQINLMELLWYSDALSYTRRQKAMTGLIYRKNASGALPIAYRELLNLPNVKVKETVEKDKSVQTIIIPSNEVDYSVLDEEDTKIIDMVVDKFVALKPHRFSDYMKDEPVIKETRAGDFIPFSKVKTIRIFQ